ncbi:MAG: hypothetical protein LBI11_02965 [Streptococcaceae bacterium]|jgi:predicted enzyme related to lactoylglutathione lyase|nr:hypothetical protein [Streptococcaceae bacterium]
MTAPHKKGLPGWVEVSADKPEEAVKFYSALFGWTIEKMEGADDFVYYIIKKGDKTLGGLSGKMNPMQPSAWLTYIETDDIDKTIADINAHGGMTYMPAMPMPGGMFTVASDPAGSPFGVVSGAGMFESDGEENGLCWFELEVNGKFAETVDFYKAVFDWEPKTEYEAPEMTYLTVAPQIGVFNSPDFPDYFNGQSQWAVTFNVADVDALAEKAKSLGATIESVSKGTPYGDFVMVRDPEGAFFVGMKPNRDEKQF